MNAIFERNLTVNQGTDYALTIIVENDSGQPVSGYTDCTFSIRPHYNATRFYEFIVEFSDSTFFVSADREVTGAMVPDRYEYTLEYTDATNNRMALLGGLLTVKASMR